MSDSLFSTDVGMYAIWDSQSMKFVDSDKVYFQYFVEEKTMAALMNKGLCVIWFSGGDGNFKIIPRIKGSLSEKEESIIHKKSLNHKLIITGDNVYFGSPEWTGYNEEEGLEKGNISKIEGLEKGIYSVDVYCLLRVEEGDKKFIDFVILLKPVEENNLFSTVETPSKLGY